MSLVLAPAGGKEEERVHDLPPAGPSLLAQQAVYDAASAAAHYADAVMSGRRARAREELQAAPYGKVSPLPPDRASVITIACAPVYQWDCQDVLTVTLCESTWRWREVSDDGQNVGAFQVNLIHGYTREWLLNPQHNVDAAYHIWLDQGWAPWSCSP